MVQMPQQLSWFWNQRNEIDRFPGENIWKGKLRIYLADAGNLLLTKKGKVPCHFLFHQSDKCIEPIELLEAHREFPKGPGVFY